MPEQVNKFLFIILLVLTAAVLVLLFWEFPQKPATPPPSTIIPLVRPEASFEQEVDNVPLSDLETDFREIEADLNSL